MHLSNDTPEAPPIDLIEFRRTLAEAGIESIGDQMLEIFLTDSVTRLSALARSVRDGDPHASARAAHGFRSGAANVRAHRLAELLQSVEVSGNAGNAIGTEEMTRIEHEFERVAQYVRANLVGPAAG